METAGVEDPRRPTDELRVRPYRGSGEHRREAKRRLEAVPGQVRVAES